jgi:hypothetical protein
MRLLPFRATLVIMLIVANFVIAFVAVRNLADATTYTTQPDWHALAVGDREYIVLLRKVKNPACN